MRIWTLHGDGKTVRPGASVAPLERLAWPRTVGLGMQHVVAMAGATLIVPRLTGLPATTTLFFSAIGTFIFLIVNRNKLPSYLGSSFAFLAPFAAAATVTDALGGVVFTGGCLLVIGVIGHIAGVRWIDVLMPPVVNGAIVALIGFNLAPTAWDSVKEAKLTAVVTILVIVIVSVAFKGIIGRLSILIGVIAGYALAFFTNEISFATVGEAKWFDVPHFTAPTFDPGLLIMFVPVVLVLVAENIGHVKSIAAMTGENLDDRIGRSLAADGVATMLAGFGGGSGTTTYAGHGSNAGVLHGRVLGGGRHRAAAEFLPQGGRSHSGHASGCAGRRGHRAVRHDRPAGCTDLGAEPSRLLFSGEPHPDGGCTGGGHRRLPVHNWQRRTWWHCGRCNCSHWPAPPDEDHCQDPGHFRRASQPDVGSAQPL